jgi:hypothetical protein
MPPPATGPRAQKALHDTAAPGDDPAAQEQASRCGHDDAERNLGERENHFI